MSASTPVNPLLGSLLLSAMASLPGSLCAAPSSPRGTPAVDPRPNIVLLVADDLGYGDLSAYGSTAISTPGIDTLARDGVRFTRFYVNSPECTPSRTALLTGRHPQRVGGLECAIGLGSVGRYDEAIWLQQRGELGLPASEVTLARRLRDAGYATGVFGKWHLGYDQQKFGPGVHGFEESFVVEGGGTDYVTYTEPDGKRYMYHNGEPVAEDAEAGYLTDVIGRKTVDWIARQDRPFFAYVPFTAPHSPYQAPGDGPETLPWPKRGPEVYRAMMASLDARVADVLAALDRHPRGANTLVIFISDNGAVRPGSNAPWKGWKSGLWEGGIRVPALVRWPGVATPGLDSAEPVTALDLTYTMLAAAGLGPTVEAPLDGIDLQAILAGASAPAERPLFFGYKRHQARRQAVILGSRKFINENGERWLVDLANDPAEERNLAAEAPEEVARFERMLAAWLREVEAPRLREFRTAAVE